MNIKAFTVNTLTEWSLCPSVYGPLRDRYTELLAEALALPERDSWAGRIIRVQGAEASSRAITGAKGHPPRSQFRDQPRLL